MTGRPGILTSLAAIVLAGAVYAGSLSGGYVYDDVRFVEMNPAVSEGAPISAYFDDPATQTGDGSHEGIWRPLRTLSYRAVNAIGAGPGPQRAVNLAIHLLNGVMVWLLLRGLLGGEGGPARLPALLGALAFVLHPLAAEPVAWISGRGDLLALTGMLAALLLHRRGGTAATALAAAAFLLGLLAKESAVVLPLLLVVVDGFTGGRAEVRRRLPALAVHALVLGLWLGARALVLADAFGRDGGRALPAATLAPSLLTAGLYYLRTLLLPAGLGFELHVRTALEAPGLAAAGLFAGAGLGWLAWRLRRTAPAATLAVLWALAALLPVTALQLLFPLKILVANRFAYPAVVAVAILLGWIASRGPRFAALAAVAVLAFAPLSAARAETFTSSRRLWTDVVSRDPENAVGLYGLGLAEAREENWREAEELLQRSVRADPRHPDVMALHARALEQLASAAPAGSEEEERRVRQAFDAYHVAIRMWQGGHVEGRARLYRASLVHAAWLALVVERVDLAISHVKSLLASDLPLPADAASREVISRRLGALAEEFARGGQPDLAAGLAALRVAYVRESGR